MNSPFYLTPIPFVKHFNEELQENKNFKKHIQNFIQNKIIYDLGCGIEEDQKQFMEKCLKLKAKRYIGIDIQQNEQKNLYSPQLPVEIIQMDILDFLKKSFIEHDSKIFILFGIEILDPHSPESQKYINEMMNLIYQKSTINDIIMIGNGTHGIYPKNFQFSLKGKFIQNKLQLNFYVRKA